MKSRSFCVLVCLGALSCAGGSAPKSGVDASGTGTATDTSRATSPDGAPPDARSSSPDGLMSKDGFMSKLDAGPRRAQVRPAGDPVKCGNWALTENVCCAQNCSNDNTSEDCQKCGGKGSAECIVVNAKACTSGEWPEVHDVGDSEPWHFSRSTHYGWTDKGACGFGLYGLCSTAFKFADANLGARCDAFCKAYPDLCRDPDGTSLRGNHTAPQGNYYTQFWSSLPGDFDNYLSCGECFEVVRTKKDGTDYKPGETGYTPPVTLQVTDACPCSANSKWCCGSGRDHCGEVSDMKYGCPLPPQPAPPLDHDPTVDESVHFDLSDFAMSRLQNGDPNKAMVDGVVPTRYRRVPCPKLGNIYAWLGAGASEYWFSVAVVNVAGLGSVVAVEAQLGSGDWIAMRRDPNYSTERPQERSGTWVTPQGAGPFSLPVSLRITDGSGRTLEARGAIKAWAPSDPSMREAYYVDLGVQF